MLLPGLLVSCRGDDLHYRHDCDVESVEPVMFVILEAFPDFWK